MRSASGLVVSRKCEMQFPLCRAVFVGERSLRLSRPFHYSFLVSIVEFGGQISVDEATNHLLPDVPASVMRSVARELQQEGLIELVEDLVVLSEAGLRSLADGRIPYVEPGTWTVDWIRFGEDVQILSISRTVSQSRGLRDAREQLRHDEEGRILQSMNRIQVPESIFESWLLSAKDGCEVRLRDPSSSVVGVQTKEYVSILTTIREGERKEIELRAEENSVHVEVEPKFETWITDAIDRICAEFDLTRHPDQLSDREILESRFSISVDNQKIGECGVLGSLVMHGIPVFPDIGDSRLWILRLVSILLGGVADSAEWATTLEKAKDWNHVLASFEPISPFDVIADLERRGMQHSTTWWNIVAALDWQLL